MTYIIVAGAVGMLLGAALAALVTLPGVYLALVETRGKFRAIAAMGARTMTYVTDLADKVTALESTNAGLKVTVTEVKGTLVGLAFLVEQLIAAQNSGDQAAIEALTARIQAVTADIDTTKAELAQVEDDSDNRIVVDPPAPTPESEVGTPPSGEGA